MLKAIRRYYWLIQKFAARHYAVVLRTLAIVLVISTALIFSARYFPTLRESTRIGIIGKYTPQTLPVSVQKTISMGLVNLDEKGNPSPGLASSWKISEDGRTYTFTLDTAQKWHDGSPVRPEDITYNFKEVETTTGDGTVTMKLQEPFAPFLSVVSRPLLKDGKHGTRGFHIQKTKVYSGVLQELILLSDTERRTYKFYPTESSAMTAFKLGEIDSLDNVSMLTDDLKSDSTVSTEENKENSRLVVLFFNNNDTTLTGKPARQGLAYAIKDKTFGHPRAISPIDKASWAFNPLVKAYDFDEERAKTLFYTDIKKDAPPTLEIKTTLPHLAVAEKIAEDWRQVLGVPVNVKVVTNIPTDYQALLTDYTPPTDPDQYTIWHSTQQTNFTHYSNLRVDKLLEDGRRTMDQKLRKDTYQDFQRFLLEDCPAVFLFQTSGFTVSRKQIF